MSALSAFQHVGLCLFCFRVGGFSRQTSFLFLTYGGEIVILFPLINARCVTTTSLAFSCSFLFRRRQSQKSGTTRLHTPFRRGTDRNDSNLALTFQSQCTTAVKSSKPNAIIVSPSINHNPKETQQTRIKPRSTNNARRVACDNLADGATNPYPLAMKPRDIQPNKCDIHLIKLSTV